MDWLYAAKISLAYSHIVLRSIELKSYLVQLVTGGDQLRQVSTAWSRQLFNGFSFWYLSSKITIYLPSRSA